MKVAFLGYPDSPLIAFLRERGEEVWVTDQKLAPGELEKEKAHTLVSYGYRFLLKPEVLGLFPPLHAINLHVSLLPWNRGADPNFWSFVEGTPQGVTIHALDSGMDTGEILVQREVRFAETETLRSSYETLQKEIQSLFRENWKALREGLLPGKKQDLSTGSTHRMRDKDALFAKLPSGYETTVRELRERIGSALGPKSR